MNRTEYIGKLNALYVGEKNCLEELITAYDEKDKEIERLNNIINELEKVLYKRKLDNYDIYTANVLCDLQSDFNEILQELERSDKE